MRAKFVLAPKPASTAPCSMSLTCFSACPSPLHPIRPDAKIAATVRAGAKVDNSFLGESRAATVALAVLTAIGLLFPVRAGHRKMLHANENQNGRTVKLATGEFLEIVLPENPTTGYRWHFIEKGSPACVVIQDGYESKGERVAGQGGVHRWKFQATQPGACRIQLAYQRSWEQDALPGRTFLLDVEVRKDVREKAPAKPTE